MLQATLTQELTQEKTLSLWDEVRARMGRPHKFYVCARCGATQDADSQQYFRAGEAVCLECFEAGLRQWLAEYRKKKRAVEGAGA